MTDRPSDGYTDRPTVAAHTWRECVRAATLAPSLHNSQPWLFRISDDAVAVYADRHRQLEVLDPDGRELLISVGAALFTLRVALHGSGHLPEVDLFPDADQPDLVARVTVAGAAPATAAWDTLAAAVPHRHTNRHPFVHAVVPPEVTDRLIDAARQEGVALTVADAATRDVIIGLSRAADRRERATGGYRAELARWTIHRVAGHDGVPPAAIGPWDAMETMPVRDFGLLQPQLPRSAEAFEPFPTIMVLSTRADDRTAWVRAGQALQRVLLTATGQNLATTPISQPVEVPALRRELTGAGSGRHAQMVLRIGYGRPAAATARRPLSDVLLPGDR